MSRAREAHGGIEREIAQEKAAALGRAGERLQEALDAAAALAGRLRAATDPDTIAALAREYETARAHARARRLALIIQREAVGLRQHRSVEQQFPEPRRLP